MALIKVDTDALVKCAQTFESEISDLKNLKENLSGIVSRISASWEGSASEEYVARLLNHIQKIVSVIAILEKYLEFIKEAGTTFANTDNDSYSDIHRAF